MPIQIPKIIAHRGASGYCPENTLLSMRKAAELGATWVEFDVMLTEDLQPIIIHDETLDRTCNAKGEVAKMNWQTIAGLDAGSWFAEHFKEEKIPSFAQLLTLLKELNLNINVEIKPSAGKDEITAIKTIETLERYWPIEKNMLLVSSGSPIALLTAYKMNPRLPLGEITDLWLEDWQEKMAQLHCISLNINHKSLTRERVQQVKNAGKYVLAYTVNQPARAQELFAWGVDGIFTDYVDKMLPLIK